MKALDKYILMALFVLILKRGVTTQMKVLNGIVYVFS